MDSKIIVDKDVSQMSIEEYKKWQREFVNEGKQQINYCPKNNSIDFNTNAIQPNYWYQSNLSFNIIKPFIDKLSALGVYDIDLYGKGKIVDILIPYQIDYNMCKNRLIDAQNSFLHPILIVEDGSVDVDELCEEGLCPGKILVYRQGSNLPYLQTQVSVDEVNLLAEMCDRSLEEFKRKTKELEDTLIVTKKI